MVALGGGTQFDYSAGTPSTCYFNVLRRVGKSGGAAWLTKLLFEIMVLAWPTSPLVSIWLARIAVPIWWPGCGWRLG